MIELIGIFFFSCNTWLPLSRCSCRFSLPDAFMNGAPPPCPIQIWPPRCNVEMKG